MNTLISKSVEKPALSLPYTYSTGSVYSVYIANPPNNVLLVVDAQLSIQYFVVYLLNTNMTDVLIHSPFHKSK
jgi:hypothetical protein